MEMLRNRYLADKENCMYIRTTIGLIGFIVFFLGSFFSLIIAKETSEYAFIPGIVMLGITATFFCLILHESKKVESFEGVPLQPPPNRQRENIYESDNPPQPEQELLLPPQPERELRPPVSSEPNWWDKYVIRYINRRLSRQSDTTRRSGDGSNPNTLEMQELTEPEVPTASGEPIYEGIRESLDEDTTGEGAVRFQSLSTSPGSSQVAPKSSSDTTESTSKL